uniref:UPAR/Ly6 domain-containing protein n=1 Tax=Podarcis muralis TaxID=64176 RepID=A0A670HUG5_PODMU
MSPAFKLLPPNGAFPPPSEKVLWIQTLFTKHGCGKYSELCNKTEQRDNVFDMNYNRTCCNYDLCNGAAMTNPSLPFFAGLSLALGWWLAH